MGVRDFSGSDGMGRLHRGTRVRRATIRPNCHCENRLKSHGGSARLRAIPRRDREAGARPALPPQLSATGPEQEATGGGAAGKAFRSQAARARRPPRRAEPWQPRREDRAISIDWDYLPPVTLVLRSEEHTSELQSL